MVRGVGVVGAGPGVSALHLPTLAMMPERFRVTHIADGGSGRAAVLAEPLGARSSAGVAELVSDPAVDVVAICSPPAHHARHVLAAIDAGVRAVLCEKPLATTVEDAELVVARAQATGTALVVGTHHLFDAAWARAEHHLAAIGGAVRSVSVTMSLPPNGRYHAAVTDADTTAATPRDRPDLADSAVAAAVVRQLVVGLVVHDLPLLRDLAPAIPELVFARPLSPIGVMLGWRAGDVLVRCTAVMVPAGADALWRLSVSTAHDHLDISFPPAFVHAGSASVEVRDSSGRRVVYPREVEDAHLAEWGALDDLLAGRVSIEYDEVLADARSAIEIADAAAAEAAAAVAEAAGGAARTGAVPDAEGPGGGR